MKNLKELTKEFAKRISQNSHFEHTGNNVHRVIEVEVAINVFNDMVGLEEKKSNLQSI